MVVVLVGRKVEDGWFGFGVVEWVVVGVWDEVVEWLVVVEWIVVAEYFVEYFVVANTVVVVV